MNDKNFAWLLVILGGIVKIFWVSGLKYSITIFLYFLTFLGIVFSFFAMIIASKKLEVSVAYSVFVGIGAAGVVFSEMVFFGEEFSILKISLISILIVGVIGLKFSSTKNDKKIVDTLSNELHLDEINKGLK